MDTKILITGSKGLLGTALEKVCNEAEINFRGFSHKDLDISNKNELEKRINQYKPNIIINTAANVGIYHCEENPEKAFDTNAFSVLNLAKICKKNNIILVQISSNAVFDGEKREMYIESDIPNPKNIYGLSKYAGEIFTKNNLDSYYIIRLSKLFGIRRNNTPDFLNKIIDKMRNGLELKISSDKFDTFTYSIHAAKEIISIIQNKAQFGVYHVSNQGSISYYDFVCKFAEKIGYSGKINKIKDIGSSTLLDNFEFGLNSTKIKNMPYWEEALNEYIRTYKIDLTD
jgi:dTDP-4-dehydrorhamnose reductase